MRIEILTSVSEIEFEPSFSQRTIGTLDGVEVNLISLKMLKLNKQASGRFKNLNELEHLP